MSTVPRSAVPDVDDTAESTGSLVPIEEPPEWTEDHTLDEVQRLADLLRDAVLLSGAGTR